MDKITRFFKNEEGASAVEYALLVSLIAVAVIGAVTTLGETASETFSNAADKLGSQ
ncbi:MAG: Flp family type IVb pilin [Thermodesulfobacteriota bacterium]|nr:Flp family type IVb pilin [Thermodesulfobacteriota bacterium]